MQLKSKIFFLAVLLIQILLHAGTQTISYTSDSMIYMRRENKIFLEGNVNISSDKFNVKALSVVIDKENKTFFAKDSINLTFTEGNKIDGDSLYFDYEDENGIIYSGKSTIDKGYFKGSRIYALDESRYYIEDGFFTTCEYIDDPHFGLFASSMSYYDNDRIVMKPAILFLRNVPIFALPFAVLPAASTRKSGFLMPKPGYDDINGFYLKNLSYFWAVNDFSDMTFSADIYSNRGFWLSHELRILVKPLLQFNANTVLVNEFSGRRRWSLQGDYSHNLPADIDLKSKWDYISDLNLQTDYDDSTVVNLKRTTETFLSLSKRFSIYSSNVSFSYRKDFSNNTVRSSLPSYRGYLSRQTFFRRSLLFRNGLNYSHSHAVSRSIFSDSTGSEDNVTASAGNRIDTYYKLFRFFTLSPYALYNGASSDIDTLFNTNLEGGLNFTTQIYGTSRFGFLTYEKFRHTLIPSVRIYSSRKTVYSADDLTKDTVSSSSRIALSVNNVFEGKSSRVEKLAQISISTTYNMDTDSISPLSAGMSLLNSKPLSHTMNVNYNVYTKDYSATFNTSLKGRLGSPFRGSGTVNYTLYNTLTYSNDSIGKNQVNGSLRFPIGSALTVSSSILYDLKEMNIVSSSVTINRDLHCWRAAFSVSSYGTDMKYNFSLTLKEFSDLSIDKDILGPLFL